MRQVVVTRHGAPEVLAVRESPDPIPGDGEVRVAVRAAGVNFADLLARMGLYPDAPKPPFVVGYEVAGHVDAVGPNVAHRQEGERVLAVTPMGGYADRVVVPASLTFPLPAGLTDIEAAAIPVNYLTAHIALYRSANIAPGETVLIHNAAGGVGLAATALARLRRAVILGTAAVAKLEALRAYGVDHPIDRQADVAAEVRRLAGRRGVDVVLDAVGGRSFDMSYRLLAPLGRLVIYGVSSVAPGERRRWWSAARAVLAMRAFKPIPLMNQNRTVIGLNLAHLWGEERQLSGIMTDLLREFEAGRMRPIVAKTFPLEQAADAHRFLHRRQNIGKVVLTA